MDRAAVTHRERAEQAGWSVVCYVGLDRYYCRRPALGLPAETTAAYLTQEEAFKAACEKDEGKARRG